MEPSEFGSALHNFVSETSASVHLFKLLMLVDIEDLKAFAHQQIDKMGDNTLRNAHHTALSMNHILSSDVVQHILSFGSFWEKIHNRSVCKQWNRLYKLNEENKLRIAYQRIRNQYPEPLPPGNKTWVLHHVRRHLHPIEQRLDLHGPLRNLDDIVHRCKSGDRVLIHEAITVSDEKVLYGACTEIGEDIHFIGLFPKYGQCQMAWFNSCLGNVILDNLSVDCMCIQIGSDYVAKKPKGNMNSRLTMRNCKIECDKRDEESAAIYVRKGSSLTMKQCNIWQKEKQYSWRKEQPIPIGIEISPFAKEVNIDRSSIKRFDRAIVIERCPAAGSEQDASVKITIKHTAFEEISEYAVAKRIHSSVWAYDHDDMAGFIAPCQETKLQGTVHCILNGNTSNTELPDCNTLQLVSQHYWNYPNQRDRAAFDW